MVKLYPTLPGAPSSRQAPAGESFACQDPENFIGKSGHKRMDAGCLRLATRVEEATLLPV